MEPNFIGMMSTATAFLMAYSGRSTSLTLRRLGGAPTYLLHDYVARHIIVVLCLSALCGRDESRDGLLNGEPRRARVKSAT